MWSSGMVLDRSDQPPNPAPDWISELAWDNVVELEQQVPHFIGITKSFEDNPDQWEDWYRNAEPENPRAAALPGADGKGGGTAYSSHSCLSRIPSFLRQYYCFGHDAPIL